MNAALSAKHLPRYAMPLVGRERELAEVTALIARSPMTTLSGPGGIGKTRLAAEVCAARESLEPDGIWFVDLVPVDTDVAGAVAAAMDVELTASQDPLASLIVALRSRRALLVLDNCEHVTARVAAMVGSLTQACPYLRILATSRQPLGVTGEAVYRLGRLDDRSAIELFSLHARHADPSFEAGARNAAGVRDICRRLDGIALAIAIVASCVRTMPLRQLRARLDGRFALQAQEKAGAPPRHETMQALLDWSYDLLSPHQHNVFRRLGAFNGGFSAEAAAGVVDPDPQLERLVDASMLERDAAGRYRLLEPMRRYALQRMQDLGEESAVRRAHATYFAEVAARVEAELGLGSEEAWRGRYLPDLDNFRGALEWARSNDAEVAANIAIGLSELWGFANVAGEGLRRCEVILAMLDRPGEAGALRLLLAVARIAIAAHTYRRGYELAERARTIAERVGDEDLLVEAKRVSGRVSYLLGIEPERSLSDLREALEFERGRGQPFRVCRALRNYASALAQTQPEQGQRLLEEALALGKSIEWPRLSLQIEINVAEREFRSGQTERAVTRAQGLVERLRRLRSPVQLGNVLVNLSAYLSVAGAYDDMLPAAREAIAIGRAHGEPNYVAIALQSIAVMHADRGDAAIAANLLGYVDAFYVRYGMQREQTEAMVQQRLQTMLAARLDASALQREIVKGTVLGDDDACALGWALLPAR